MYIYIYIYNTYVYIYIYIYTLIYIYIYMIYDIQMYTYVQTCISTYTSVCVHFYIYNTTGEIYISTSSFTGPTSLLPLAPGFRSPSRAGPFRSEDLREHQLHRLGEHFAGPGGDDHRLHHGSSRNGPGLWGFGLAARGFGVETVFYT